MKACTRQRTTRATEQIVASQIPHEADAPGAPWTKFAMSASRYTQMVVAIAAGIAATTDSHRRPVRVATSRRTAESAAATMVDLPAFASVPLNETPRTVAHGARQPITTRTAANAPRSATVARVDLVSIGYACDPIVTAACRRK